MQEIEILQTKNFLESVYEVYGKKSGIFFCSGKAAGVTSFGDISLFSKEKALLYRMEFKSNTIFNNFLPLIPSVFNLKTKYFEIYNNDNIKIGEVYHQGRFGGGHFYYNIENYEFMIYHIGLGKKGEKLLVFDNKKQVALIDRSLYRDNCLDKYFAFIAEDDLVNIISLFIFYFDYTVYGRQTQFLRGREFSYLYTFNKKQKSLYDENFTRNFIEKEKAKNAE